MQNYLFLEALSRRIHHTDEQYEYFQDAFYRVQAGLAGEQKLQKCLEGHPFKHDYQILHNFQCMNSRGFTHQIDALLITVHFILVLEVKHLAGQLYYQGSTHQFSRKHPDGFIENMVNPFDQVYRHKLFIKRLLEQHWIDIPVFELVIISNYRSQLDPSLHTMPIIHLSGLPSYIERLFSKWPQTNHSVQEISTLLKRIERPISHRRTIEHHRIKPGVFCPKCSIPMPFYYGQWRCPTCHFESKEVVWDALHDYRILINEQITNKDFRWFTGISSIDSANRLLRQLQLPSYGEKKGRYYKIPIKMCENNGLNLPLNVISRINSKNHE